MPSRSHGLRGQRHPLVGRVYIPRWDNVYPPRPQPRQASWLAQSRRKERWCHEFKTHWNRLYASCPDRVSRDRLEHLRRQFEVQKRGVSEPAWVEVDTAALFSRAGFAVAFLEESGVPTADLECYLDLDRLFVEVTALIRPLHAWKNLAETPSVGGEEMVAGDLYQTLLLRRLVSRMAEKSRQLSRYCAPVLLAITVPHRDVFEQGALAEGDFDLQWAAGLLTEALASVPQLSGLLLTCWDMPARPTRSNIRVSQAHWVSRPGGDPAWPRVRLFVTNPLATFKLGKREVTALKAVL